MNLASAWVVVVMTVGAGCSKASESGPPRPANGKERGDCVPPVEKDELAVGTCDPGLLCLSNLCVRPPPADCQALAELLTSFDLGNYAELEERAPIVDKYKRACHEARVSKEQGECIAAATNKMGAFECAPLMLPYMGTPAEAGSGSSNDCDRVASLMRSYVMKTAGNPQDPQMTKMLEAAIGAMKESCLQDSWPPALTQCILSASPDNLDAMNQCNSQMPPDLQKKLTDRMMKIMQERVPQAPTTPF